MTKARAIALGSRTSAVVGARAAGWVLFLFCASASARVYQLGGGMRSGAVSGGQPGWTTAYRADLRINEGGARLEVMGCALALGEAARQMDEAYRGLGAQVALAQGERMAWGVALFPDRVVRLLVTSLTGGRECVVFRIEQSRGDYMKALQPPARLLPQVPQGMDRRPVLRVVNEETKATTEISRTAFGPQAAAAQLRAAFAADGWRAPLPSEASQGGVLYQRGREVCLVRTSFAADGQETLVTLVYKKLGAGP